MGAIVDRRLEDAAREAQDGDSGGRPHRAEADPIGSPRKCVADAGILARNPRRLGTTECCVGLPGCRDGRPQCSPLWICRCHGRLTWLS